MVVNQEGGNINHAVGNMVVRNQGKLVDKTEHFHSCVFFSEFSSGNGVKSLKGKCWQAEKKVK